MNAIAIAPDLDTTPANDQPKKHPRSFTRENARDMALRGWAKRKLAAKQTELLAERGATISPQCATIMRTLDGVLLRIQTERNVDKLGKLTTTAGRLFKMWQVLAGVPNPGSRRGKQRGPISASQVEPLAGNVVEPLPEEPKSGADCPK